VIAAVVPEKDDLEGLMLDVEHPSVGKKGPHQKLLERTLGQDHRVVDGMDDRTGLAACCGECRRANELNVSKRETGQYRATGVTPTGRQRRRQRRGADVPAY